jgi:hypothetical protein
MTESAIKGAGLSVGVAEYNDKVLSACPAALDSAREVARALNPDLVPEVRVVTNPPSADALFKDLEKTIRSARGGAFFLYFAGHALRREDEILLAAATSEFKDAKGCVPLSDIVSLLRREQVARSLILLNIDQPPAATTKPPRVPEGVAIIGSTRAFDPTSSNTRLRAFSNVVLEALRRPALEMAAYLTDGRLDADGLGRYLLASAPKMLAPAVLGTSSEVFVVRDLAAELAAAQAAAQAAAEAKAAAPPPEEPAKIEVPAKVEEAPVAEKKIAVKEAPAPLTRKPASRVPYILVIIVIVTAILYYFTK